MVWGKNGTPNTLTTAGANMNVSDLGGSKFNVVLSHTKRASGNTYSTWYFNNENSSSSYSSRQSENGGSDGTRTSANTVFYDMGGDDADKFSITYIFGISSAEKLAIGFGINAGSSAGASGVPERGEFVWKWADTSNTVDRIDNQSGEGTYDTDSNLTVLGSDLTPADAIPFPTNVQVGSRAEITDTRKMYILSVLTFDDDFSTDKGWVSSGAQAKIDSSGYLLFDDDSDGSAHKIYYDIGNILSDTKWLWRFKLTTNTFSMNTDPTPQIVHMRISNKTDHRDSATEDAIGMSFRTSDGNQEYIRTTYSDGITFGTTSNFSTDMATGTHYVQITRDSSTQFTVKLYSDSSYSSLVESNSVTIPSTITDLRYLKIDNMTSDGTSNGRMIFHIDDLEVYSGVNSISDTDYDTYWQEIGA